MYEPGNRVDDESDGELGSLLRAVGARAQPSATMMAEVRAAVDAEWRATCAARRRRRQLMTWSAAAGIAAASVGAWLARPLYLPAGGPVASLARVEGTVEYRSDEGARWRALPAIAELRRGDELRTGAAGRAAVTLASGVELRLDNGTAISLDDIHHARLRQGAVYVDSGVDAADDSRALEIDTPAGAVRHLGTQYEARLLDGALRVGVREGRIAVGVPGGDVVGRAGEQLTLEDGQVLRQALAPNAATWAWIGTITPPFAIEGQSVHQFLAWAGRETGRQVVYASPEAAQQARDIVLRGSVAGLTPDDAVTAVLATTALQASMDGGRIRIEASRR